MKDDILIDNYLRGLLSKDEEQSFLKRLKSDIDFNEKFQLEKQLFDALDEESWSFAERNTNEANEYLEILNSKDIKNLKKTLAETSTGFNSKKTNTGNKRFFYYLAAASIIVLLGFQMFFNQNISNQDLYEEYVGLNDLPSFVSRSDGSNKLANAQELFEKGQYADALDIFNVFESQIENRSNLLIYKGLSYVELEDYENAEQAFNDLVTSDLLDAEKGYWYKALLYLKQDKVLETEGILETIVSENFFNSKKARDLLKEL
ncbi:tetratricopeptide repeat protein [Winogradskyella flava]|uniref:Tetratricopeptide repeat-containing protein n=1 Tax=Winogradskyella flava TaxID=1884876 RepID=A0A842IXY7_9FLAO|nr:hypothetical protein [Winogradskyella flava]MBC2846543.1 hypothetical protein [Winogradskyella flava]